MRYCVTIAGKDGGPNGGPDGGSATESMHVKFAQTVEVHWPLATQQHPISSGASMVLNSYSTEQLTLLHTGGGRGGGVGSGDGDGGEVGRVGENGDRYAGEGVGGMSGGAGGSGCGGGGTDGGGGVDGGYNDTRSIRDNVSANAVDVRLAIRATMRGMDTVTGTRTSTRT